MSTRIRVLAVATSAALVGLLASAGTTLAASPSTSLSPGAVQTITIGGSSDVVLPIQVDRLYPGAATSARFILQRGAGFSGGTFAVGIDEVKDLERDCNPPEVDSGDTTCGGGDDQGELSGQITVGHSWFPPGTSCEAADTPVTGVPLGSAALELAPAALSAADEVCLVIGLILPFSANNLVQTDLVRFDLRLGLQDVTLVTDIGPDGPLRPTHPPSPAASSSPDAVASPSPITGGTEQPAVGAAPSPSSSDEPDEASAAPTAAGTPTGLSMDAAGAQPRLLPFTGTSLLPVMGWAALSLVLGLALLRSVRRQVT